jgi:dihydropteroate synthase
LGLEDVILDVGFGFGKTIAHNYTLLNSLDTFQQLHKPLLVGISRKSMVYKPLKTNAEEALNGTTALHMIALQKGASILRVHDVKEAVECVELWKMLREA